MKAQELRIRNIVEPITMSPCMVTGILDQEVKDGVLTLIYCDYKSFLPQHIQPVELTEEWLKNTNLRRVGDLTAWYKDPEIGDVIWYSGECYYHKFCNNMKKIEYVHQLQNLIFALTGKYPEIK